MAGADRLFTLTMPSITTGLASIAGTAVTLNGSVTNMGVASDTYTFFEYGVTPALGDSTTNQVVAGADTITTSVSSPSSDTILYYRIGTTVGGVTSYGATREASVPSATGSLILKSLLRVVVAATIIAGVLVIGLHGGGTAMLISTIVGLIAFTIVDYFILLL
jgi:hypothetical protein